MSDYGHMTGRVNRWGEEAGPAPKSSGQQPAGEQPLDPPPRYDEVYYKARAIMEDAPTGLESMTAGEQQGRHKHVYAVRVPGGEVYTHFEVACQFCDAPPLNLNVLVAENARLKLEFLESLDREGKRVEQLQAEVVQLRAERGRLSRDYAAMVVRSAENRIEADRLQARLEASKQQLHTQDVRWQQIADNLRKQVEASEAKAARTEAALTRAWLDRLCLKYDLIATERGLVEVAKLRDALTADAPAEDQG